MAGWTRECDALLRQMITAGASYTEAAAQINAAFSTSYTRNAAIGRGKRIGLSAVRPGRNDRVAGDSGAGAKAARTRAPAKTAKAANVAKARPLPRMRPAAPRAPVCVPVPAPEGGYALLDLPADGCRFPSGEGAGIRFCGRKTLPDLPYCASHMRIAYRPADPKGVSA